MTPRQALSFVRKHGVVLESARGAVPTFAETVAGEPIAGSWWAHPRGREIFALTRTVRASPEVLVCRLVDGKITYVHRRLWPAVVRLCTRFPQERLAQVREVHAPSGRHITSEVPFPEWVPGDVPPRAEALSLAEASRQLEWLVPANSHIARAEGG